jgi:hypothetical protein
MLNKWLGASVRLMIVLRDIPYTVFLIRVSSPKIPAAANEGWRAPPATINLYGRTAAVHHPKA